MKKILKRHGAGAAKPKKISTSSLKTDAVQPPPPISHILSVASVPSDHLYLKIHGLGNLPLTRQLKHVQGVYDALQNIDVFLLSCSDVSIKCTHQLDQNSSIQEAQVNIFINVHNSKISNDSNAIYSFLDKGRQAILISDYSLADYFETLVRTLTKLSTEFDKQVNTDVLCNDKCINKVKLARVIEALSRVNGVRNTDYTFEISSSRALKNLPIRACSHPDRRFLSKFKLA